MTNIKLIVLLSLVSLTACQTLVSADYDDVPKEVNQLVQKRQACLQLQINYAKEKSVSTAETPNLQGCDNVTLAREFRQLREKYQHNRAATDKLDGYAGFD